MNVLSLFDGMSCGQIALERAEIKVDNYFASEIKKHAIKVTMENYPDTIQVGDVTKLKASDLPKIDLLIGGSPCQNFSNCNVQDRRGFKGEKSSLFFEYLRLLKEIKPKYFLLENVKMSDHNKRMMDAYMGCSGIYINSNLVSFQNRSRYYWTNIPHHTPPTNKHISFQDYKDTDLTYLKQFKVNKTQARIKYYTKQVENVTNKNKIGCLVTKFDTRDGPGLIDFEDFCRTLTIRECELAQTVPVGYTKCLSNNQAINVLGDGWTVDVIVHLLQGMKPDFKSKEKQMNKWV